jgi:hypothetical protein
VDPGVRPILLPFEVLSLERAIQLRVVGISDEESSKGAWKLGAKTASSILHERSDESRRYSVKLMISQTPIALKTRIDHFV